MRHEREGAHTQAGDRSGAATGGAEERQLRLVRDVHATPHRMVMAFSGAGAQALAWLHAVGGSSRTVLEAVDLYAERSIVEWVGFTPAHFTTHGVAKAMAETAWRRARKLTEGQRMTPTHPPADAAESEAQVALPVFGLGCTASIATDRPKRGEHRVVVAVRDGLGVATYALTLEKGARDRAGEERLVSEIILRAVADACGVLDRPRLALTEREELGERFEPAPLLAAFDAGERPYVVVEEDGTLSAELPDAGREGAPTVVMLSGAFNPVHEGHLELARVAAGLVDAGHARPAFELPLVNADKSPIGVFEGRRRAQQFAGRAPLVFTREPLFAGKAALFPGTVFVVGVDTAERIMDQRFYGSDRKGVKRALETLRTYDGRLLVAARRVGKRVMTLRDVAVPAGYEALFEAIPEDAFRRDLSSTEIRGAWSGAS